MRARTPLYTWRRAAGLTQAQLAPRVGLCLRAYKAIEADTTKLPGRLAEECAAIMGPILGVTIDPYRDLYLNHYTPPGNDSAARPSGRQTGARGRVLPARGAALHIVH